MSNSKKVLYISYDGMTDPLGQGQVLAYLQRLSKKGFKISLISFEKKDRYEKFRGRIEEICRDSQVDWHPLMYTKKPPVLSTVYDISRMWSTAKKLHAKNQFDIVHCRSYIASMVGVRMKRKFGVSFIFDMRGFWIDEKIESGEWNPNKFPYTRVISYLRKREQEFYQYADDIITLTHAAKEVVKEIGPFGSKTTVIPTCVDLAIFKEFNESSRNDARARLGIPASAFVLLYSGGYGGNYDIDFLISVYRKLKSVYPDAYLLILSKDGNTGLGEIANDPHVKSTSLPYHEVSNFLMAGDLGVVNYKNMFSVAGRSPTKLGEYWASGLPSVAPPGIGDLQFLFDKYKGSGVLFTESTFEEELIKVRQTPKDILRTFADDYFSIEKGTERYSAIYNNTGKNA